MVVVTFYGSLRFKTVVNSKYFLNLFNDSVNRTKDTKVLYYAPHLDHQNFSPKPLSKLQTECPA